MNVKTRYFVYGFLFGLSFPVMAVALQFYLDGANFTLGNVILAHRNNPLIYMIDSAPVFLGLFAFMGGISKAKSDKLIMIFKSMAIELEKSNQSLKENADQIFHKLMASTQDIQQLTDEIISGNETLYGKNEKNLEASEKLETSSNNLQRSTLELIGLNKALKDSNDKTLSEVGEFKKLVNLLSSNFARITNIGLEIKTLSINSSIEASKNGVAGKSFSVIARQIKDLSEDINELNVRTQDIAENVAIRIGEIYDFIIGQNKTLHQILQIISEVEVETSTNKNDLTAISHNIENSIHIQDDQRQKFSNVGNEIQQLNEKKMSLIESLKQVIENNSKLIYQMSHI